MTGPRRLSHDAAEELISASLTGDLTDAEAADLAAHLAACDRCTATAAAWADSRRVLSGVRHVAAPRDLGARVRTGIERGRFTPAPVVAPSVDWDRLRGRPGGRRAGDGRRHRPA